jgi:hypothetical protein
MVTIVFVTAATFLPSRCLANDKGIFTEQLPSNDRGIFTQPLPSNDKGIFTEPLPSNDRGIFTETLPSNDKGDTQKHTHTHSNVIS